MKKTADSSQEVFAFVSSEVSVPKGTSPVSGDAFLASATFERRAASRFVTAGDTNRKLTTTGLAVQYEESGLSANVEMRSKGSGDAVLSGAAADQLREIAKNVGGTDEDVLDLLLANAVQNHPDEHGWNWIDVDDMLVARSRGVRIRNDGSGHRAGYDDSAREDVWQAVRMYAAIFVSYGSVQISGRKKFRDYSPLIVIERVVMAEGLARTQPVRIAYRFGSNLGNLSESEHSILVPRSLLQLNTRTEAVTKAVGRYFVLNGSQSNHSIVRSVSDILMNAGIEIPDHASRGRLRTRVEKSLDVLVDCGVFPYWNYADNKTELPSAAWADSILPYQNWLDTWLTLNIQVRVDVRHDSLSL